MPPVDVVEFIIFIFLCVNPVKTVDVLFRKSVLLIYTLLDSPFDEPGVKLDL